MAKYKLSVLERFWSHVDWQDRHQDECWEWKACTYREGYGKFHLANLGQPSYAHRVLWEELNGPIPNGMCVLHTCDNPPCVNPSHLYLGTRADNIRDREARGHHKHKSRYQFAKVDGIVHGKYSSYINYGCRCDECYSAALAYWRSTY